MKRINIYYTLEDLHLANWVLFGEKYADLERGAHNEAVMRWAIKVKTWFTALWKVARLFHRQLRDWQMSVKAVWQCIRRFRSANGIFGLLRQQRQRAKHSHLAQRYQRHTYRRNLTISKEELGTNGYPVNPCRPKTSKHTLRTRCARIANALQSACK